MASITNFTCPAAGRLINTTLPRLFTSTVAIEGVHHSPRWGHTNNITQAITGTEAEKKDYVVGLVISSIVLCVFFLGWMIFLIVLKCLGYNLVGFLSGNNTRIPPRPGGTEEGMGMDDDDEVENVVLDGGGEGLQGQGLVKSAELEAWEKTVQRSERRIRNIRIVVIISGLIIVVMAILMVVFGIQSLEGSLGEAQSGLEQGADLANSAVGIIDTFLQNQNDTVVAAQDVVSASDEVPCLKNLICQGDADCLSTSLFSQVPAVFQENKDAIVGELVATRSDLSELATLLTDINATIGRFYWAFWVAAGAVILMAVCTLFILNGVILAWQKKLRGTCWQKTTSCIRGWFIVPIFIFLLLVSFIFAMVFVIGSQAAADFCYNSPDGAVLSALGKIQTDSIFQTILFKTLEYYIQGCPGSSQIAEVGNEIITKIRSATDVARQAGSFLLINAQEIAAVCNEDTAAVENALFVLQMQMCTVWTTLLDILDFFTCANFNGVYATVTYDSICHNANTGFVWISATQFVILFFATIMLTLRVAFYELVDESELIQPRGCCRRGARNKDAETEAVFRNEAENPDFVVDNDAPDGPKHVAVVE